MARIRTIKPEFFTSEDIVSLSPLARLLYIATWCEADKEGRMAWKPLTLKLRYLPADNCDIKSLCQEIIDAGLVVLYDDGLAYIPGFTRHQHVNPRESTSTLPAPKEIDASARVSTREHLDLTRREEGKGREGKGKEVCGQRERVCEAPLDPAEAGPPPPLPSDFLAVVQQTRQDLDAQAVWLLFCEHYPPTKRGLARWKKWVFNEVVKAPLQVAGGGAAAPSAADPDSRASIEALGVRVGLGRWDGGLLETWAVYKTRVKSTANQQTETCQ